MDRPGRFFGPGSKAHGQLPQRQQKLSLAWLQFLPTALLLFVAGHTADRYERKRVVQLCQI